jgi:hypothetical protein
MLLRSVCIAVLFICSLIACAQSKPAQSGGQCPANTCNNLTSPDTVPIFPTVPSNGKWETLDFKPGDAAVSCSVVKYELAASKPIVHLLCPDPKIYAPLRVHLALSFTENKEIPDVLRQMLVDVNSPVKFRSASGNARAQLTLHNPGQTQSQKEWVKFTKVNVALVLPAEK